MSNVYYNPESFGLTVMGQFDWCEVDYSFDMCVVWKDAGGAFWIGNDSGCSCPSPFEDIYDLNELDGPHDRSGLKSRLERLVGERVGSENVYSSSYIFPRARLMNEVSEILSAV